MLPHAVFAYMLALQPESQALMKNTGLHGNRLRKMARKRRRVISYAQEKNRHAAYRVGIQTMAREDGMPVTDTRIAHGSAKASATRAPWISRSAENAFENVDAQIRKGGVRLNSKIEAAPPVRPPIANIEMAFAEKKRFQAWTVQPMMQELV